MACEAYAEPAPEDVTDAGDKTTVQTGIRSLAHVERLDEEGQLVRGWPTDPKEKDTFLGFYGDPYFKPSYNLRDPLGTEGMNDEHKWGSVTAGLIKRGYKDDEIVKIIGGNWLRVIADVVG